MTRVLITGAGGMLGRELQSVYEPTAVEVIACDRDALDVGDRDAVLSVVTSVEPDLVIHAAAMTRVDDCESETDAAYRVNALSARWMREACEQVKAHLCYVSTDYVFDGTKETPYLEWDRPNPQSVYGSSKLAGEVEAGPEALVVRTSWVCGRYGNNMVKTILRLADQHETLSFVDDQHGHPTFADGLAATIHRLMSSRYSGVFHVTHQGPTTWFDFARDVLTAAGQDPERVRRIATAELEPPRPAPRPANSVLDNAALRLGDLPVLPDHHGPLRELVQSLRS
jgi:dTDP-4-dehydrorhamnose reductase